MELTIHGTERIQDRTKMQVRDVLELISTGAVVSLGGDQEFEYLLFYSKPDGSVKIAVVNHGRTRLITLWNKEFALPRGILKVTHQLAQKAHDVSCSFYSGRRKIPTRVAVQKRLKVRIDVVEGKKTIYTEDCGYMSSEHSNSLESTLSFLSPQLQTIVPLVEANKDRAKAPVRYDIWCIHEHRLSAVMRFKVLHEALWYRPETGKFLAATE